MRQRVQAACLLCNTLPYSIVQPRFRPEVAAIELGLSLRSAPSLPGSGNTRVWLMNGVQVTPAGVGSPPSGWSIQRLNAD
jgi:hypothetical protein